MSGLDSRANDPLVIRNLEFLGGQAQPGGWRPEGDLPEVAFAGRSNVGKSSLLNTLVRRKSFARVSQHPGKTREINFYRINDAFLFVDLPGYGYARVSQTQRGEWRVLIEAYLRESTQLRGVVQLVDIRHDPADADMQMLDFLASIGAPTIVVLTKSDKLTTSKVPARAREMSGMLGLDEDQVVPFSATTGAGREELAVAITQLVEQPSWRE